MKNLIGGRDPLEAKIEATQYNLHLSQGLPEQEARRLARMCIEAAIETCKKRGEYGREPSPRWLFEMAAQYPKARAYLDAARREGVRDEDIEEWHSIPYVERAAMEFEDNATRTTAFMSAVKEGLTPKEAAANVRRYFAAWGDPDDSPELPEQDRLLPVELLPRLNQWRVPAMAQDPEGFKKRIEAASSFNALMREAINSGEM